MIRDFLASATDEQVIDTDLRFRQLVDADTLGCKVAFHNFVGGPCLQCPKWFRQLDGGRGIAMVIWNTSSRCPLLCTDGYVTAVMTNFVALNLHLSWQWSVACYNYRFHCQYRNRYIDDHESIFHLVKSSSLHHIMGSRQLYEEPYYREKRMAVGQGVLGVAYHFLYH